MPRNLVLMVSCLSVAVSLSGCIIGGAHHFAEADARVAARVDGHHDKRFCVPDPHEHGDDVTIKLFVDLQGGGEFRLTGIDGPEKVFEVDGGHGRHEGTWYRGWNTGEVCVDVTLDAKGSYALGAYLE